MTRSSLSHNFQLLTRPNLVLVKQVPHFQLLSFPDFFFQTDFSETLFQQISSLKIHLVIFTKEDWQNQQAAGNSSSNKALQLCTALLRKLSNASKEPTHGKCALTVQSNKTASSWYNDLVYSLGFSECIFKLLSVLREDNHFFLLSFFLLVVSLLISSLLG